MQPESFPFLAPDVIKKMSVSELIERIARYNFRDEAGHPLENCAEFRALVSSVDRMSEKTRPIAAKTECFK